MKKFALHLQVQTIQILTNDVQMQILCLSYFITSVQRSVIIMTNALVPKPNLISLVIHYVKMCVAWAKPLLNRWIGICGLLAYKEFHILMEWNDHFIELCIIKLLFLNANSKIYLPYWLLNMTIHYYQFLFVVMYYIIIFRGF